MLLCASGTSAAANGLLEVYRSHSRLVDVPFDVSSIAVGDPAILKATAVTPRRILVNGQQAGATSLMFFGRRGEFDEHRVLVVHDVSALRHHLRGIDPRIRVTTDPNRNALVLSGTVATEQLKRRALDAALSFVGTATYEVTESAQAFTRTGPADAAAPATVAAASAAPPSGSAEAADTLDPAEPDAGIEPRPIESAAVGSASRSAETVLSRMRQAAEGAPQVVDLLTSEEVLASRPSQLEGVLSAIDPSLRVSEVNGVLQVRGTVANPTVHARALALIESFVSPGEQAPGGLRALSDRGGVLVGEDDALQNARRVGLTPSRRNVGGGSTGFGVGSSLSPSAPKGNIGQNLSRADAVLVAGGRAISLMKVREQPRVEVQIRIVAVDRDLTDQLGINWRIDGSRVSIGNLTGGIVNTLPSPSQLFGGAIGQSGDDGGGSGGGSGRGIDTGAANLIGLFRIGSSMTISAFLQAVEQSGAGTSLSEPLLTAVSGEMVSFLVGGEVPLPVSNVSTSTNSAIGGTTTVSNIELFFRQFGIQLFLRPTVLDDGRISLVLDQSISAPDFSRTVNIGGNPVPGFSQRSVQTLTETADGETWAVAGLITSEDSERLQKVPFLGDVPLLGKLFQSKNGRKVRSELIITVTARKVALPAPATAAKGTTPAVRRQAEQP